MTKIFLTKEEESILESIKIGSDNNPMKPGFPPDNPKFPATPIRKIEVSGFKNISVKDESVNSTGTFKDRLAWKIVTRYSNFLMAKKEGLVEGPLPQFSSISYGNTAIALAEMFEKYKLPKPKILVDVDIPDKIHNYLKKCYCEIYTCSLHKKALYPEEILKLTNNLNGFDITSNEALDQHTALYDWMSFEIINETPDYILVPFGSGCLYENICNTIKNEVLKSGKKDPRLNVDINKVRKCHVIGVTVDHSKSEAYMLYSIYSPFRQFNKQWISFFRTFGYVGGHSDVHFVNEEYIREAYELLNSQGIRCEHSGATGLAYLLENKDKFPKNKKILVINTGRGKWCE